MSLSFADIEREITRHTVGERARLIALLIESLAPAEAADVEAAWEQEILRRSKEIEDGSVIPAPADEVLDRVRRGLA